MRVVCASGVMLAAFLGLIGFGLAQTAIPSTPAGTAFQGWLTAFNSESSTAYLDFVQKSWPAGVKRAARFRDFRKMTGGFDLRKIDPSSTPTKIVALVQERGSDQFGRLTLTVDDAAPHNITGLSIDAIPRPADFALPHLNAPALLSALRDMLNRQVAADTFSGTVLVAKDGKPIFAQAYGLADIARKVPNTLETRFRIGSMNKMFTAVSILQLAQAGKLHVEDPIGKYLTDYPNKNLASTVTVHQLLTHTGGTGDIFGPDYDAHRLTLRTLNDYINLYGKRDVLFKPGSRWEYSNYGFVLLGAIVERVSGQNYYDYVRQHVYVPAGMKSTGSDPEDTTVVERSVGYTDDGGKLVPNTDTLPYRGSSAGGGYSTVGDLLRFANALQKKKLLNARYTQLLTLGKVAMPGGGRSYAYGFGDQNVNGIACFGHDGGAPGMNGDLEVCGRYVVAVLANRDPGAAQTVSDFIINRLPKP